MKLSFMFRLPSSRRIALLPLLLSSLAAVAPGAPAAIVYDLAEKSAAAGDILRFYGCRGSGSSGLPLAGGRDIDGDGNSDVALAMMTSTLDARMFTGEIVVLFSNGTGAGEYDSGTPNPNILHIEGAQYRETVGNEIWVEDVTGDGLADILVCRQNYSPSTDAKGAGAFTIIKGGPELRMLAASMQPLQLASPPAEITLLTLIGRNGGDRLGIWTRAGDVDGDGINDILVGADQADCSGGLHCGEAFLIRGGEHLAVNATVPLAMFGTSILAGDVLHIVPPTNSSEHHFSATNYVADLDGNGRAELILSAALNRAGAALPPDGGSVHATGGAPDGRVYILWDDAIPPKPWGTTPVSATATSDSVSVISGGTANIIFGEEIAGGADFDASGKADLFIADFRVPSSSVGTGYILYDISDFKGMDFTLDTKPDGLRMTNIVGPNNGAISSDTVMIGDYNNDGIGDLAVGSPHANPLGRATAGTVHVIFGREGGWPEIINLAPGQLPELSEVMIIEIIGANGTVGSDKGDTLAYSGMTGDMDNDGVDDLIFNEMVGNGVQPGTVDVGNLVVIRGSTLGGLLPSNSWRLK